MSDIKPGHFNWGFRQYLLTLFFMSRVKLDKLEKEDFVPVM